MVQPWVGAGRGDPGPEVTCPLPNLVLRRRVPVGDGPGCPKYHLFAKNRHYSFTKSAIRPPFGWIRHDPGPEISANSTFWTADRVPDGLGYAGMKGRAVLGIDYSGPAPKITYPPFNPPLRRRVPVGDGPGCPKYHSFAKKRHYCFAKSAIRRPFGRIRHESGSEKTAFSTFWTAIDCGNELG